MVEEHEVSSGVLASKGQQPDLCSMVHEVFFPSPHRAFSVPPPSLFDLVSQHIIVFATARKWRRTGVLGSAGKWQYEVDEVPQAAAAEDAMMVASSSSVSL